ncbi:MAG: SusC/RagA family protein, partial [Muribaculaceae bacterium]|nr:SusC/RagA family protein [Muribaculaceae bacterium]
IIPENATIRASNSYLYTDPDDPNSLPMTVLPQGGILYHSLYSLNQYDLRLLAQYNKEFNGTHLLNVMGGFEVGQIDRHTESFTGFGISYENGNIPFTDWHYFKEMSEKNGAYFADEWTHSRSLAYVGTASYAFKNRYVFSGTYRYEGSNKLGKTRQSRWLPTWNVSGAWNIDNESWFQNPVLATAKFRASYSLTADGGPSYVSNAQAIYYPSRPWRQDTEAHELGIELSELANTNLTYEKKHELDFGVDLGFLNNRINFTADWYKRDNFDLIGYVFTEGAGGAIRKWANSANLAAHGVEFTLTTHNIQGRDFSWTTDLTFSYVKNKITKLNSRSRVIDLVQGVGYPIEGYPVRAIFSIPFAGLTEDGLPQIINERGEVTTWDINFQDFENLDFLKYEGPVDPPYTGGFGNNFRWKGFHLNVFMTYAFGNKIRLDPVFAASYSDLTSMPKECMNRWTKPGDEKYTSIPAIASLRQYHNETKIAYCYNAYNYSTARIANGD